MHISFVPFCRCYHLGNFKRFFCMIAAEATELQLCLVEPFLNEVSPDESLFFPICIDFWTRFIYAAFISNF